MLELFFRITQQTRSLHKIINPERRRKPRRPSSRQHMIWTTQIITNSLRRVTSKGSRAGMSNVLRDCLVVTRHDLDVLRRELIHECTRLVQTLNDNYGAVISYRRPRDLKT